MEPVNSQGRPREEATAPADGMHPIQLMTDRINAFHGVTGARLDTVMLALEEMRYHVDVLTLRERERQRNPVLRLLKRLRSLFVGVSPLRGYTASHHLVDLGGGDFESTGIDPQFALLPRRRRFTAGWYRIRFSAVGTTCALNPVLYVETAPAFAAFTAHRLAARSNGCFEWIAYLPDPILSLRLDPCEATGRFHVTELSVESLSGPRVLLRALRHNPRRTASAVVSRLTGRRARYRDKIRKLFEPGSTNDYANWIDRHDRPSPARRAALQAEIGRIETRPLISVVMPTFNTPAQLLREAIDSVIGQIYDRWELCIADDGSAAPHVRRVLSEYSQRDSRIKVVFRPENGHISQATNSAFALATGEWIALLDHDDLLPPQALAEVALEIDRHPEAQLIYSDEDKLDGRGRRRDPYFKPDYSRELFRSQNYLNHLTVHRAENIRAVGGWRSGFEGSQDYDLNLRVLERIDARTIRHIPKILYHWRMAEGSTAVAGSEKGYAYGAGLRALAEHVERLRLPARVEEIPGVPFYRLRFAVPEPPPLVSLIIPTRDRVDILRTCITSILEKTTYSAYEILVVDNGSVEAETKRYFEEISARPNVRILSYEAPFNYSAINNFAARHANGSILGLVNNDIEVISPDWLTEMVSWAVQPDIGCVGAKLYYPNDTIQHAGVILGVGGVANHAHLKLPREAPGYFGRAVVVSNFSAVTGACLLVRRSAFDEVAGLDADNLAVAFNDVDFCLRVREAGYSNVWTPFAELYHHESASRGVDDSPEKRARFIQEVAYMQRAWNLADDPFYSPHLTHERPDFSIGP